MPSVAALTAPAANRLPWSKYKINKTGPATTGSTIRIPATRGPQRLPASEEATTSRGEQQLQRQDSHWCSVSQELLLPSLSRSAGVVGLQESDEVPHCRQGLPQFVRGQLCANPVAEPAVILAACCQ
jgi:hypothetical protein